MNNRPKVSFCIPTNGMPEWVIPALDSIYAQEIEESLFEVIVSDNKVNSELEDKIQDYKKYSNFIYRQNETILFENAIEAYKLATGELIKFVNNKMELFPGTIQHFIDFVDHNRQEKPIVYFSNGTLFNKKKKDVWIDTTFNDFVKDLGIQNSNGDGIAIWKEDFDKLKNGIYFNKLFPDMTILYSERKKSKYIIDNTKWNVKKELSHAKKGKYDLYYAFSVEYLSILIDLLRTKDITIDCFLSLKQEAKNFVYGCYWQFNVKKLPCSYDISCFDDNLKIYYGKQNKFYELLKLLIQKVINKIWKNRGEKR